MIKLQNVIWQENLFLCTLKFQKIFVQKIKTFFFQVRAMLPGGMDVQGLFFVTEEDIFQQKNESKVIDCLQKLKASMKMDEPVLWPVFHIK